MSNDDPAALQLGEMVQLFQAMTRPDREAVLRFARCRAEKYQAVRIGAGGPAPSDGALCADLAKSSI